MNIIELFQNEYLALIFGGVGGIITAWITQRALNRRGVFSYFVKHLKIGVSADDSVFGNVAVTWNNKPVNNLYLSTIELVNESLNDYENVVIQTFSSETSILSESSKVADTPLIIQWTDNYKKLIHVEDGQKPNEAQLAIYSGQREHVINVFNRGDTLKINYLNESTTEKIPSIWLSASVKGVKVKFRIPDPEVFGVSQKRASIMGVLIGFLFLFPLTAYTESSWLIAIMALIFGLIAQVPGAFAIKLIRWLREVVGG